MILALTETIDNSEDDSDGEGQRGENIIGRLKDDLFAEEDDPHRGASFSLTSVAIVELSSPRPIDS
jgi:hypothetical protein